MTSLEGAGLTLRPQTMGRFIVVRIPEPRRVTPAPERQWRFHDLLFGVRVTRGVA